MWGVGGGGRDDAVANSINEFQKHPDSTLASATQLGDTVGNHCHQNCT